MTTIPMASTQSVSDVVADTCARHTDTVFGLMGNGNAFFTSNVTRRGLRYISARHEAGTVAMADAYHRASGKIAVATVTYGAGFTNCLTSLTEAAKAHIPVVVVVGDVPTTGPRAWDIDQEMVATGLGVQTLTVARENALAVTERAWALAARDKRPVIVAIPYDLATVDAGDQEPVVPVAAPDRLVASDAETRDVVQLLAGAVRPLIIAGRGAVVAGAGPALRELGDGLGALFATSVMARNIFDSPWDLGIAGGFGRLAAVDIMRQADVILVVGASLNTFQTRYGTLFDTDATVIQVDSGEEAVNAGVSRFVRADAAAFAATLLTALPTRSGGRWRDERPEVAQGSLVQELPEEEFAPDGRLNPRVVAHMLDSVLPANRTIVQDGGHFIGWAPMYCSVPDPHALMMVGTAFQTIGLGLPSAVGAAAARPDRLTVLVSGDGGALMGLADLDSLVRTVPSGVMVVFNDAAYGAELHQYAVRGLDDTAMQIDEVDFAALGKALGASGTKMRSLADLKQLRDWLDDGARGLFVLDVAVSQTVVADYMRESMAPILAALAN
jgi:acetolactate synthase I/II/III large subunit